MHFSSNKQWNQIKIRKKEFGAKSEALHRRFTNGREAHEKIRYSTSLVMREKKICTTIR